MKKYRIYQVNSFTQVPFAGNPAGVVSNADGLTEKQMQLIARELNNSETAFIFQNEYDDPNYDVEVRFFTPTTEVPICGHATIAAHFVRALEHPVPSGNLSYQKTKAGILPVKITGTDGNIRITMTQGQISIKPIAVAYQKMIVHALGLNQDDRSDQCPIQIVSTGHSKVIIGIKSKVTLNKLSPNLEALKQLSAKVGCNGFFVFTLDSDDPGILTHGRMFAPAIGIAEDPVTGNANGPLGAYLVANNIVATNGKEFSFTGKQGEAIGRPGTMDVKVTISNGSPVRVDITGSAVTVFVSEIEI
ncbi:PhzF family isomerase [Mucilaginibacter sp.]|uniref:PhzF family isomerase n=1 Tax=Mucilaginibacter sp. TaxID=1882438 RepID=UPI00356B089F